ncbi:hypothetical protein SB717_36940, partial [Priestia sp. SIMBA_032]
AVARAATRPYRLYAGAAALTVAAAIVSVPAQAALGGAPMYTPGSGATLVRSALASTGSAATNTPQASRLSQQSASTPTAYTINETTL